MCEARLNRKASLCQFRLALGAAVIGMLGAHSMFRVVCLDTLSVNDFFTLFKFAL